MRLVMKSALPDDMLTSSFHMQNFDQTCFVMCFFAIDFQVRKSHFNYILLLKFKFELKI